ncbi:MAG: excinuclease ABC subunit UvrC [Proteobacteria bacterium]|nr:excinuclease ABC subunit UvrC [Pseudomonadota bacterium]
MPDAAQATADTPPRRGSGVIRDALKTLPSSPGVYRMLDDKGNVLYVGKARNLRKRVSSYAAGRSQTNRILRMVAATVALEVVTTHTEVEALLLESNLIKKLKPRYNILLRDDKSFPYIVIRRDHPWAQIGKYRGKRNKKGEFFGPFATAGAVNRTISALQKAFPLRSCSDSIFESRTRPCLQYQIKRCTAPCVGRISTENYERIVDDVRDFLRGQSSGIQARLSKGMTKAADGRDYEMAAVYRDRIRALTQIQARQDINVANVPEADVIAAHQEAGQTCIQVFFFRAGQNYGNRAYFPSHTQNVEPAEVLSAFLGQFYANKPPPRLILTSHSVDSRSLVEEALATRTDHKVRLVRPQRGAKADLVRHAEANARDALRRRLAESASQRKLLESVAKLFGLETTPERIEVYDNSHISGTNAVGAMIVAGPEGLTKNAYRKFNIKSTDLTPGDDYAMMREVLTRRFSRLLKEDEARESGQWPDLVLIDGGAGHLSVAREVFADLGVAEVGLAAIAKGPERNAGREKLFLADGAQMMLHPKDPALYFLQRLRDEAHRFAIGSHRAKRARAISRSALDEVPGVGAKRKHALLHHFGSAAAAAQAGSADLEKVNGISKAVAKRIYEHFHSDD